MRIETTKYGKMLVFFLSRILLMVSKSLIRSMNSSVNESNKDDYDISLL